MLIIDTTTVMYENFDCQYIFLWFFKWNHHNFARHNSKSAKICLCIFTCIYWLYTLVQSNANEVQSQVTDQGKDFKIKWHIKCRLSATLRLQVHEIRAKRTGMIKFVCCFVGNEEIYHIFRLLLWWWYVFIFDNLFTMWVFS